MVYFFFWLDLLEFDMNSKPYTHLVTVHGKYSIRKHCGPTQGCEGSHQRRSPVVE